MTPISRVDSSTLMLIVPDRPMPPTATSSDAMITRNTTMMLSESLIVFCS